MFFDLLSQLQIFLVVSYRIARPFRIARSETTPAIALDIFKVFDRACWSSSQT